MMTSFTRIVVVLSLLRTALGTATAPPNSVIIALAMFLTAFVMGPVLQKSYDDGIKPLVANQISVEEALQRASVPLRGFMEKNVREKDLKLFMDLSGEPPPATPEEMSLRILVPAFMISELKRAFEIGFLLFLPFLIIDLVVASVLMSMGMMMLPPVVVSLPFKLIFFVLVDGWSLVAGSLVQSYGGELPQLASFSPLRCNRYDGLQSRLLLLAFALAGPIVCPIKGIHEQGFMRVSIITGGGSGIGAAVARRLATPDDCLMLHGQAADAAGLTRLKAVAMDCQRAGANVAWRTGDLAHGGTASELVSATRTAFGSVDAIVHAAGCADRRGFTQLPRAGLERAFAVMAAAFHELATAALPDLTRGSQGRVVAVSSFVAHRFTLEATYPASSAAKAALEALVKCLAIELASSGATANVVLPC